MSSEARTPWHSGGWIDESWDYTDEQKELIVAALETALDDQAAARLLAEVTEEARAFRTFQSQWELRPGDREIRKQLEQIEKTCGLMLDAVFGLHGPTLDALNEVRVDAYLDDRKERGDNAASYEAAEQLVREMKERAAILRGTARTACRRYEPRGRKRADIVHMFAGQLKRIFDSYAPGPGITYVPADYGTRGKYDDPWTGRFVAFGRACAGPLIPGSVDNYLRAAWSRHGKTKDDQAAS
jgi:hypothetical protein